MKDKPKKIAIISDFAYPIVGGTEKYVFEAAEYLSKTNKVRIISPIWSPSNPEENFRYKRFNKNLDMIRFNGPFRKNKIIKPLLFLINLIKYCRGYDVINSHYYSNALAAIIFGKLFKKKVVITLYEVENLLHRRLMRIINKADRIIAISDSLKKYAEEQGLKNVEVVTPWIRGIKKTEFNSRKLKQKYELGNKKVILYVGRIIKTKGVELLVRALPELIKKNKNFKVVFIGAKIEEDIIELPKKLGIEKYCEFTGFVTDKVKEEYYQLCDILIYPPYVKGGFGFVLLEAMKYGKAVIGSSNWGVPDAVGDAGIIIPEKNVKAITESLAKFLSNEKLRTHYGKLALERAKAFEKNRVLNVYKRILCDDS